MNIQVEWAILTKYPMDSNDYRVLASSGGGLDAKGYLGLIQKWATGEVPVEANRFNPAAPWYQFGMEGDPLQQVVLQTKWTEYADYRNRPVLITTCLLVPFGKLAKARCGFKQMAGLFEQAEVRDCLSAYAASIAAREEKLDFDRLAINLPEREEVLRWTNQLVEEISSRKSVYMQAANMLLRGSLGFEQSGGEIMDWEERVKWLDALLALLPYGLRSECPASLWASSGKDYAVRLYWGRSARQGHGRVEVPSRANAVVVLEGQDRYIKELNMLLDHQVSLEKIVDHLAAQGSPRSFGNPQLDNVLGGLGDVFIILGWIREEAPNLTSKTIEEANKILASNGLAGLSEMESNEFILGLLPQLKAEQIDQVLMYWNEALAESVLKSCENSFQRAHLENSGSLRVSALLLLRTGKAEVLFRKIWNQLDNFNLHDPRNIFRDRFIQIMHNTLQDGKMTNMASETISSNDQAIKSLVHWVTEVCLSEDFLYAWARMIVSNQTPISHEPLLLVLREYSGQSSGLIEALKQIWEVTELSNGILDAFNVQDAGYLATLIQAEAFRTNVIKVFTPATRKLLAWDKNGDSIPTDAMRQMLTDSRLTPQILSSIECALLDEMRLLFDINPLSLPGLLSRENNIFLTYQEELDHFLGELPPNQRSQLCDRLYHSLMKSVELIPDGDTAANNLKGFCKVMQWISQGRQPWDQFNLARFVPLIRDAVMSKAQPADLALVCQPVLQLTQVDEHKPPAYLNWDWLIKFLSQYQYPNTAVDLYKLVSRMSDCIVQLGGDGAELESRFHQAVINDGKILVKLEEREKYAIQVSQQVVKKLMLLDSLAPGLIKFREGKKWLLIIRNNLLILQKKLSGLY